MAPCCHCLASLFQCCLLLLGSRHISDDFLCCCQVCPQLTDDAHPGFVLQISAGSADKMVNIWDAGTRNLLYKLPGHHGSVNEAAFHPHQPIVASASSDKCIYLGELAL